jgi:homoserine kinase type II
VNAITQLDLLHLEETVSRYDIGELVRYWPATTGSANNSYFLRTMRDGREREFILTTIEQPAIAGGPYVSLLDACASYGLPVAAVIRNREGSPYDTLDGNTIVLTPRLPGRHVYNPTVKQVQALARFIGRFHIASADQHMPSYARGPEWLREQFALVRPGVGFARSDLLAETVGQVSSMLERCDVRELPSGIIHADLFRDNVLFNERGLTGVLDFHAAADGYLVYDLAVAANDWCNDSNGILDPERTLALLRAYQQIRPLTRHELWFFSGFTLYAALVFWLLRLAFAERGDVAADVRFNNPEELQRIVEQHSAHFFYLDERLLV